MIIILEGDKLTEEIKFKPYIGEPDIERLIRAMRRQEVDRILNVG